MGLKFSAKIYPRIHFGSQNLSYPAKNYPMPDKYNCSGFFDNNDNHVAPDLCRCFCSEKVTRLTEGHGEEFLTYHHCTN